MFTGKISITHKKYMKQAEVKRQMKRKMKSVFSA